MPAVNAAARMKAPVALGSIDDTILCIATYFKGDAFLRECRRQGCTVLLLTTDTLAGAEWPREAIDEIHSVPRDAGDAEIRRRVDEMARRHRIDRIAALDDFDVEMAAMLREHLRVPGMGRTTASRFPRQARDADAGADARHPRARVLAGVQRSGGRRLGWPRGAAVGAQAAVVGGGDRDQEGRRSRRALARARRRRRRARAVRARAVRAGRRLPRRLDRLGRRGRLRRRVQVRAPADGDFAPGRHLHHAPAAGRLRRRGAPCSR